MGTTPAKKRHPLAPNAKAGEKSRQPPKARIVLVDLKKNCGNKICAVFLLLDAAKGRSLIVQRTARRTACRFEPIKHLIQVCGPQHR